MNSEASVDISGMGLKYEDIRGLAPPSYIWDSTRSNVDRMKPLKFPTSSLIVTPPRNLPAVSNAALRELNRERDQQKIKILKSIDQSRLGSGKASNENNWYSREEQTRFARKLGLGASGQKQDLTKAIRDELEKYDLLEK